MRHFIVSIHAPARGATDGVVVCRRDLGVSIHAPARGATVLDYKAHTSMTVSIHAPARGATQLDFIPFCTFDGFNPRPCTRGDADIVMDRADLVMFQSTPLHEGRPAQLTQLDGQMVFQSTPLHEGRPRKCAPVGPTWRFNPRPCTRGDA